jgi:FAD/FMN-containing dehydrogenase
MEEQQEEQQTQQEEFQIPKHLETSEPKEQKEKRYSLESLSNLKKQIRGKILLSGDEEFDKLLKETFNYEMIKSNAPMMILQPVTNVDVLKILKFAHENRIHYSVRAGGHSASGNCFTKDGLMIDMSLMKSIHVNLKTKEVTVEPGCTIGDLDYETTNFNLAVPSGCCKHVGVSGLALQGGYGVLSRKFGLMCDNLISVDVVLPNEKLVQVDDKLKDTKELMYGIR